MAFIQSIRNTDLKENIGVSTNLKNENVSIASAKKKTILCDVGNTVYRNQNTPVSAKKSNTTQLKATDSVFRTPFIKNQPKKNSELLNTLFRDKIQNSAPPRVRCHKAENFDEYDADCKHCLKYNGVNDSITPTLTMADCEKFTTDPFPEKNKKAKNKATDIKYELIEPFVGDDFLADIGMLPSPTISSLTFDEFENCYVPPVYYSDSE